LSKVLIKDASLALTGAEYVREKLVALAGLGPTNLYDQVYAIKVRVKSLDSLVSKVLDKRKKKPYQASDATDIVGMRLLCLYAEDLPNATKALIRFIRFCQKPEIGLISGALLSNGIKEVIVYKSERNARVYDSIFKYCKQILGSQREGEEADKVFLEEHEGEEKSYSSIHFVCYGISYASGIAKEVPIEIQIRTIFEDTWGEIDHSLEYKMRQKLKRPLRKELQPFHANYRKFLNQLKGHLEDAGKLAENVRSGYEHLYQVVEESSDRSPEKFRIRRIFWGHRYEIRTELGVALGDEVSEILKSFIKESVTLNDIFEKDIVGQKNLNLVRKTIEEQLIKCEIILKWLGENTNTEIYGELYYFIKMENAIYLIWKSQINKTYHPLAVDDTVLFLEEARDIYFQLEKDGRFTADAMLNFRLACTMQELGMPEGGEFFLTRALDNLLEDKSIENSVFKIVIPHHYSFFLWKKRADLLSLGIRSQNPRINSDDQKAIVIDALYHELLSWANLKSVSLCKDEVRKELELIVSNNIISYVWEILDLSQSTAVALDDLNFVSDLVSQDAEGYKPEPFVALAAPALRFEGTNVSAGLNDTLMKYYHIMGDVDKVRLHKQKSNDLMQDRKGKIDDEQFDLFIYAQERTDLPFSVNEVADGIIL
jgi:ppGpp synthetase/RelA/SpoT-type nucleotidyltranferase